MIIIEKKYSGYMSGFVPYALAALLISSVGGFTAVLAPAFVSDLNLAYNNTTWTALAMAMSTAAFAPVLGKLGDIAGRRLTLLIGIAIFTLGNILTAISTSLFFMLIARFTVGIGTAAIAPVVMSYIVTEFPPDKIAKGFSLYMLISSVAVIFGPTLGGMIIEAYSWRVMMWVCVAICVITFFLCVAVRIRNSSVPRRQITDFDAVGAVFVLIFFSLLLCIPSFGQNFGWNSKKFFIILSLAAISFVGLCIAEKKAVNPILQWNFMMRKTFVFSVLALFLTQGLMQANMTNIIVFINYTQPQNSIISSYAISIMYIGMSLGAILLGPLADRKEPKYILALSFAITGIGCALMLMFSADTSFSLLAASLGILGFGLGANGTIFMKVVLSGIPAKTAGAGTGTYGLFRDLSAPFGVAVFVPLFTNKITSTISSGSDSISAAVDSIHFLSSMELVCIAAGTAVVLLLPGIYKNKGGAL